MIILLPTYLLIIMYLLFVLVNFHIFPVRIFPIWFLLGMFFSFLFCFVLIIVVWVCFEWVYYFKHADVCECKFYSSFLCFAMSVMSAMIKRWLNLFFFFVISHSTVELIQKMAIVAWSDFKKFCKNCWARDILFRCFLFRLLSVFVLSCFL